MLQDTPATCDGCGKNFLIRHTLSCPRGGLVLVRHDETAKDWVTLGAQALVPSAITYKPKINSRIVQGERNGAGARQEGGGANGRDTVLAPQGGRSRTVNGVARLVGQPGQVEVPAESRADVSAHSFWKLGITKMFDIQIFNLNTGSYLSKMTRKDITKAEK